MAEGGGGGGVNCEKEVEPAGGGVHLVDDRDGHLLGEEGRETYVLLQVKLCEGGGDIVG